jgi:hypothetical protein
MARRVATPLVRYLAIASRREFKRRNRHAMRMVW